MDHGALILTRFLLICLGGAVGTGARYLTALWAASAFGPAFPFGTLIVNLAGSFLLGFLMQLGATSPALTTGVMGGFTTYSTFNYETTNYFREGAWLLGATNIAATLIGCLVAGLAGIALARILGR
jgi:CrcB protein